MSACSEFTQNAWRHDLCANCQRLRSDHSSDLPCRSSPARVKRTCIVVKSSSTNVNVLPRSSRGAITVTPADIKNANSEVNKRNGRYFGNDATTGVLDENINVTVQRDRNINRTIILKTTNSDIRSGRVAFTDGEPDIIGYDGGLDNFLDDDGDCPTERRSSVDDVCFSEEEKHHALLALKNMVWNSDIKNLKDTVSTGLRHASSKVFEDIELQLLCKPDRFLGLRDCDATFKHGTFPVRVKPSFSKLSVEEVFNSDIELHRIADNMCDRADSESSESDHNRNPNIDKLKFETSSLPSSSTSSGESEGRAQFSIQDEESDVTMPYKIVNIIPKYTPKPYVVPKENAKSYSLDDIEECLYGSEYEATTGPNVIERESSPLKKDGRTRADGDGGTSDTESTVAGLEVVELLNDVLASYSEIESKYSDFRYSPRQPPVEVKACVQSNDKDSEGSDSPKSKKNADFEKSMASVAANLDLQKSRKGRQAPRRPSSPPPEPQVSPTRKLTNQIEPNFKMVTVGKPILSPPPMEPLIAPKATSEPLLGLDDPDTLDVKVTCKSTDIGKAKRGITSFFRNILRRGRDDIVELSNPDITFVKVESKIDLMTTSMPDFNELKEVKDDPPAASAERRNSKFSPQPKFRILAPSTPPPAIASDKSSSPAFDRKNPLESHINGAMPKAVPSPPLHKKGLASPKQRLKRDQGKSSPTMQRAVFSKDEPPQSSVPQLPANPPPVPQLPSNPPPILPQLPANPPTTKPKTDFCSHTLPRQSKSKDTSTISSTTDIARSQISSISSTKPSSQPPPPPSTQPGSKPPPPQLATKPQVPLNPPQTKPQPPVKPPGPVGEDGVVVRRRPKSPKKGIPPQPPTRTSVPARMNPDSRNPDFARELERRLNKSTESGAAAVREPKKAGIQGPPSPTSPVPELDEPSPTTSEELRKVDEDSPREKIELPTAAPMSRKSFLGKLGNKKVRAPQPPISVKRAKSITETTLPRTNKQKKINVTDISGPVLVTDMTNTKVLGHRRNTISLGDNPAFSSGGTMVSSGVTEKDFDDLKPRVISPLGSLENLYESILPKYDPITAIPGSSKITICPNVVEGYLEPVPPVTTTTTAPVSKTTLMSSSMTASMMQSMPSTIEEEESVSDPFDEEPDLDEDRKAVLASQPIYEEINGYTKFVEDDAASMVSTLSQLSQNTETDFLVPQDSAPRSQSRETISSESDPPSGNSTLSRPRPAPRRKPKKGDRSSSEQYVAMNRPNAAITLHEDKLRELHTKLGAIMLQSLQDVYTQVERILSQEKLTFPAPGQLKWSDFDIYGQALHASERCIVYNAKFKINNSPCQLMLLHSRPATEGSTVVHPSLLKPGAVFADTIPFSFLTQEFITTSQLVQNSIYDSSLAKCFCAVGSFNIIESLDSHLSLLRETLNQNVDAYTSVILSVALQVLSAMSHCLDQGYTVTETDFRDIFLVSRPDLRGKVITFLPRQRSHDVHQGEAMCRFLDKLLKDVVTENERNDDSSDKLDTMETLRTLLQPRKVECLALVRSVVEYLLWGPNRNDVYDSDTPDSEMEQDLCLWLEQERAGTVAKFAKMVSGFASGVSLEEYYCLKFLLKSSPASLVESAKKLATEC